LKKRATRPFFWKKHEESVFNLGKKRERIPYLMNVPIQWKMGTVFFSPNVYNLALLGIAKKNFETIRIKIYADVFSEPFTKLQRAFIKKYYKKSTPLQKSKSSVLCSSQIIFVK